MDRSDDRTLLILRHARAETPWGTEDRDRGLTKEGHAQARWVGEYLRQQGLGPDGAVVSDARRTRATYAWVAAALGDEAPSAYVDGRLYEASATRLISVLNETEPGVRTLVVVAHQPAVQDTVLRLASADSDEEAVWEAGSGYPTASLAVFSVPGEWTELDGRDARLRAFVSPPALHG